MRLRLLGAGTLAEVVVLGLAGSYTSAIFFDYSVYVVDARGVGTKPANADFT